MDISPINKIHEETILETPDTDDTMQLEISVEEDEKYMVEDVKDDEEKELMEEKLKSL